MQAARFGQAVIGALVGATIVLTSTGTPAARAADGSVRLDLVPGANQLRYRLPEQRFGQSTEASGATSDVTGSLLLDPTGAPVAEPARIAVDLRSLHSSSRTRDTIVQRDMLQTHQFPIAEFVPQSTVGMPFPLPTSGEASFQILGDLTLHGVTRPTVWQVTAQFSDQGMRAAAFTDAALADYNIAKPNIPLVKLGDVMRLELNFQSLVATDPGVAESSGG